MSIYVAHGGGLGPDSETEGSSIAFVAEEMDTPQRFVPPPWARKFTADDFKYRGLNNMQVRGVAVALCVCACVCVAVAGGWWRRGFRSLTTRCVCSMAIGGLKFPSPTTPSPTMR
jgi:hypothetical protein